MKARAKACGDEHRVLRRGSCPHRIRAQRLRPAADADARGRSLTADVLGTGAAARATLQRDLLRPARLR
ncbi:MAG: hypothetical protein ACK55Z_00845, partial [bacterium]